MRRVVLNVAVSLDGYIEGPNGEYDWCFVDQDYGMAAFFEATDAVFMGRKSYDLIATSGDLNAFPELEKFIFSDTLAEVKLTRSSLIRSENFVDEVKRLKETEGKNIWLFGGADLIASFIKHNLIDDYFLSVHPVILGGGKPLFTNVEHRVNLMHIHTQSYNTGLVQSRYVLRPEFKGGLAGYDY